MDQQKCRYLQNKNDTNNQKLDSEDKKITSNISKETNDINSKEIFNTEKKFHTLLALVMENLKI